MNENTINADVTMGGAADALLAGRYRAVKQLGQGGMGSVWLAEDVQLDNRQVAIKMLPSVLVSNKRAYAQLKAEALVSLKLTHPNIATVRSFEENNGNPFLVVDYIDGVTLDDFLAEKDKLSEEETMRLLSPVAAALDYAHSKGVIHRDVKPGNVMIAKDGTPYIHDFGIAREIQETMTRVTGKLSSGTLLYMSPEQLHGAAPTPAQDVYSFAAMAYECLTGHPPFSRGQIEYQIEHDEPAPLDPQFANCGSGVMSGLAKRSDARPESCVEVLAMAGTSRSTGTCGTTSVGRARSPSAPQRTERAFCANRPADSRSEGEAVLTSPRPKRSLWLVALFVLTGLAAGIGAVMWHRQDVMNRRLASSRHSFEQTLGRLKEYDARLVNVSPEDGFRSRIEKIREEIPCGVLRDRRAYDSAETICRGLIERCEELIREDACRVSARAKQKGAQESRQLARDARASEDDPKEWNAAESAYDEGERILMQRQFENAGRAFVRAKGKYDEAVSAATSAREDRKKREQVRKDKEEQERLAKEQRERTLEAARAAEAEKRKKEAEVASKPKVVLMATLNGESVAAEVVSGLAKKGVKTPVTVDLSNWRLGEECTFVCSYDRDGVRYSGRCPYVVRPGKNEVDVTMLRVLDEGKSGQHRDRVYPQRDRGEGVIKAETAEGSAGRLIGNWSGRHNRRNVVNGFNMKMPSAVETFVFRSDGTLTYEWEIELSQEQRQKLGGARPFLRSGFWKLTNDRLQITVNGRQTDFILVWSGTDQFELRYLSGGDRGLLGGGTYGREEIESPRLFYRR